MLRKITALLASVAMAIPTVGLPTLADARPLGHRFCQNGVADNLDLANRWEEARQYEIAHNLPAGSRVLRACNANGVKFLAGLRQGSPEAADRLVTMEDGIRYLREETEVVVVETDARFISSCVRGITADASDVLMRCQPEGLRGVRVLRDKRSGRYVLILRCANPGVSPLAPAPCGFVLIHVMTPGRLSTADMYSEGHQLTQEEEAQCPLAIAGPVAGGSFAAGSYRNIVGQTAQPCDFADTAEYFNMRISRSACVEVQPGWYAVRVHIRHATDGGLRLFNCFTPEGGEGSLSQGAEPATYRPQPDRSAVAVVWYNESDVPEAYRSEQQYFRWQYGW
jgi:hypothetical protein